jgi:hypothetical protein
VTLKGRTVEHRGTTETATTVFGVLRLPKVTLCGVWNGETGEDWQRR